MIVRFRASFAKDLRRIQGKDLQRRIKACLEKVEQAQTLAEVPNLKKLKGGDNFYRVRVGEYRLGLVIESDVVTFVRCLDRKELYRYFP